MKKYSAFDSKATTMRFLVIGVFLILNTEAHLVPLLFFVTWASRSLQSIHSRICLELACVLRCLPLPIDYPADKSGCKK